MPLGPGAEAQPACYSTPLTAGLSAAGLLVRDGFEAVEVAQGGAPGRRLRGLLAPDWNKAEHFWVFEYTRQVLPPYSRPPRTRQACRRAVTGRFSLF